MSASKASPSPPSLQASQAEWLEPAVRGAFNEVYVIDRASLRLTWVNDAACAGLLYTEKELVGMSACALAPAMPEQALRDRLAPLDEGGVPSVAYETVHVRKDGSSYPVELRFFPALTSAGPAYVAVGNDVGSRRDSAEALRRGEARFRAMVSNTPGLVYQFLLGTEGAIAFPYLSEGCHALLGLAAERLREDASCFTELILPEDRASFSESMRASAAEMKAWNWEGRIWIEEWNDIKWINLRATPRETNAGGVLWEGIMSNITESKREQAEIRRSRAQLAELSAHVEKVKEAERMRIAREIHDDVGGNLTAIKMALSMLTRRFDGKDEALLEKAAYVDSLIDRTFEAVHRIAGALRPGILDFGIVAAIDWQAKEFEKQSGIPCQFRCARKEIELDSDQATALFRIFQESLSNISKHAQASKVAVTLERKFDKVILAVTDNGRGITRDDRAKPNSFGIRGMAERAVALGGELSVKAPTEGGTVIVITMPITIPA